MMTNISRICRRLDKTLFGKVLFINSEWISSELGNVNESALILFIVGVVVVVVVVAEDAGKKPTRLTRKFSMFPFLLISLFPSSFRIVKFIHLVPILLLLFSIDYSTRLDDFLL